MTNLLKVTRSALGILIGLSCHGVLLGRIRITCGGSMPTLTLPFSCQSNAMAFSLFYSNSTNISFCPGHNSAPMSMSSSLSFVKRDPHTILENLGVSHMSNGPPFWYFSLCSHFSKYSGSPPGPSPSIT